MLGHFFNRQYRPTYHSTVTVLQGCLKYPHHRILSLQSCPDCSPCFYISLLTTFQYMMAGIHLDVQLFDNVCIFLKEVWQARSAWNIPDSLTLLLLLRKNTKVFRACGGGSWFRVVLSYTQTPKFANEWCKYDRNISNIRLDLFPDKIFFDFWKICVLNLLLRDWICCIWAC